MADKFEFEFEEEQVAPAPQGFAFEFEEETPAPIAATPEVVAPVETFESADETEDKEVQPSMLERFSTIINTTELLLATQGLDAKDFEQQERTTKYMSSIGESLANVVPTDAGSRVFESAKEGVGQIVSSPIQAISEIYSGLTGLDEKDLFTYQAARTLREGLEPSNEFGEGGFFTETLPHGLTTTAGFIAGGAATQGLKLGSKIAPWMTTAFQGMALGGQGGREEAIEAGATEEQADMAYWANAGFGLSEAVPVTRVLDRIDTLSGGLVSRNLKGKLKEVGLTGVKGAIEEALQEGFQTFGANWTAKDIAGFDPNRGYLDNITDAAIEGGSVGFLLSMAAGAIGVRLRTEQDNKIEKEIDAFVEELRDLNEISGPYMDLTNKYFTLLNQDTAAKERIAERGHDESGEERQEREEQVAFLRDNLQLQEFNPETGDPLIGITKASTPNSIALWEQSFKELARLEINQELEGKQTWTQRFANTHVVSAMTQAQRKMGPIKEVRKQIEEAKDITGDRKKFYLARQDRALATLEKQHKAELEVARAVKTAYAKIVKTHMSKNAKVTFDNHALWSTDGQALGGQYAFNTKDGMAFRINLNTNALFSLVNQNVDPIMIKAEMSRIYETALHEIGHAVVYDRINTLWNKIDKGIATQEEAALWMGLKRDYEEWLIDNLATSSNNFLNSYFSPMRQSDVAGNIFNKGTQQELKWTSQLDKGRLEYFFSFDEFLAEQASKHFLQFEKLQSDTEGLFKEIEQDYRKLFAEQKGKFKIASGTFADFFRRNSLKGKIAAEIESIQKNGEKNIFDALKNSDVWDLENFDNLKSQQDKFNWFYDLGANILQLAEKNPHIQGLQRYTKILRLWKNTINNQLAIAEDRLSEWKNLGKQQNEKLSQLLFDETMGVNPEGGYFKEPRNYTNEEKAKYGLNDDAIQIYRKIKSDFANSLRQMEAVIISAKKRIFAQNPVEMKKQIAKVEAEFARMQERPYFPLMRFGKYTLSVRAAKDGVKFEGIEYKEGQQVTFETFEKEKERDRAFAQTVKTFNTNDFIMSTSALVDPNFSLQGMPLSLLEQLEQSLPKLTQAQRDEIQKLKNDALPFKSFRKQFIRRKRVGGFSYDAQRSYANYMTSFSNHIARIQWEPDFRETMQNVEDSVKIINATQGGESTKRAKIFNHMQDHFEYVMNPVNEMVSLRSAAFFWYLGYNVKSAAVNLTQVPLVTYPYLAQRFSDGKAMAALTRANKTYQQLWMKPDSVDPDIRRLVEEGLSESWLDESLATELALAASEGMLDKTLPKKGFKQVTQNISRWGTVPFHAAEKLNRHVTGIAAFRLAKAEGMNFEQSKEEARLAVERTQFEYARWNRPRAMRGPIGGTVFVFMNYLQNALYFSLNRSTASLRMWTMLFAFAGVLGMPFGEDIADLIDAMMSWYKKNTGVKDPHTDIRLAMRDSLNDLEMNPDLILNGLSSQSFGLSNIGEFMGWPIPELDLSGSLSMGRIIPGTELLRPSQGTSFERFLARGTEDFGGAFVSGTAGIGKAIFDNNPDMWKRWEKALPAAMKQISKAARIGVRGEEATRAGYPIAGFDMHDTRDQLELVGQALGFTPTDLSRGWEGYIAQQQAVTFYKTWKDMLLRQFNYSYETKDKEAKQEARSKIRLYNSQVPYPEMKISTDTLLQSRSSYERSRNFAERQIEPQQAYRRLKSEVKKVFEE